MGDIIADVGTARVNKEEDGTRGEAEMGGKREVDRKRQPKRRGLMARKLAVYIHCRRQPLKEQYPDKCFS